MSDKDSISREKLLHTLEGWLKLNARAVPTEIGKAVYMMIEDFPAVEPPMSAVEYGSTLLKICASHNGCCSECEINRPCAIPDRFNVPIVEKWAREHPEERSEE